MRLASDETFHIEIVETARSSRRQRRVRVPMAVPAFYEKANVKWLQAL